MTLADAFSRLYQISRTRAHPFFRTFWTAPVALDQKEFVSAIMLLLGEEQVAAQRMGLDALTGC